MSHVQRYLTKVIEQLTDVVEIRAGRLRFGVVGGLDESAAVVTEKLRLAVRLLGLALLYKKREDD